MSRVYVDKATGTTAAIKKYEEKECMNWYARLGRSHPGPVCGKPRRNASIPVNSL
jgi:hypothetical protein